MNALASDPPWLETLLSDPDVTDLLINGASDVFVDRGRGLEAFVLPANDPWRLASEECPVKPWLVHKLGSIGKTWDSKHPFIDAALRSGHRLHAVFPPISKKGVLVSLRRTRGCESGHRGPASFAPVALWEQLEQAVVRGESILLCGATGSGKTTALTLLLERVPVDQRVVALEDTPELAPRHPHFLSLLARAPNADGAGEITLDTLLRQTLRMRPDRIVLGECRGREVLELLQALNTGHRGAMATLHANGPRDALRRVELLCLLASSGTLSSALIRELLANAIDWVAHFERDLMTGERRIAGLARVCGLEASSLLLRNFENPGAAR